MKETKVSFKSKGQKVVGILHEPDKKCNYTVIVIPGFRSTKEDVSYRSKYLCENGIRALTIELRGRGESEGVFEEMTLTDGINDVISAIDFVGTPVGLFGSSYGSMVALHTTTKDRRVKTLVLRKPLIDIKITHGGKIIREVEKHGFYDFETRDGIHDVFTKKLVDDVLKYNSYEVAKNLHMPILFIVGDKDDVTPLEGAKRVYENVAGPKKFIILKNEGHEVPKNSDAVINREATKWFKRWLR